MSYALKKGTTSKILLVYALDATDMRSGDDSDGAQAWVGRVGELHSGGQAAGQVVQQRGRDAFTGDDHGDAWRVGGDLLGGDASDSQLCRESRPLN